MSAVLGAGVGDGLRRRLSIAPPISADRLKPYLPSTHTVITKAPTISSEALMICTYVVPRMPPTST